MTTTAKRRTSTTPRKAAKRLPKTNGAVNGAAPAAAPRPPEEFVAATANGNGYVPTTTPESPAAPAAAKPDVPEHPYGEREVYVYQPKDASTPPIVFPHISNVRPTYHFMWKLRKYDQIQQSFEWMDLAKVPDTIQERVTLLPETEQAEFFMGWFSPAVEPQSQVGPPGES